LEKEQALTKLHELGGLLEVPLVAEGLMLEEGSIAFWEMKLEVHFGQPPPSLKLANLSTFSSLSAYSPEQGHQHSQLQ
jgi:hypothetical protein